MLDTDAATRTQTTTPIDTAQIQSTQQVQTSPATPVSDPAVDAAVEETVAAAQFHPQGDPTGMIEQTMADPDLTQAQKDDYLARIVDLASGTDTDLTTRFGKIDAEISDKLATALEGIGDAWTSPATPELRDQVTDAMARNVDSGRTSADQLSALLDPARTGTADGVRTLLTKVTDGAVLQQVAYDLYGTALRNGYDVNTDEGVQGLHALTSAADIAGMAATQGYVAAANGITAELADNPEILENAQLVEGEWFGGPEAGRSAFDSFASALNGASNTNITDKLDTVFSLLVEEAGKDSVWDRSAGLNDLGDYFNRNVERLNLENSKEGSWDETRGKAPEPYEGLTERFIRNVMLNEEYDGVADTQAALTDEMARLGNIAGSSGTAGEDVRTEAAVALGTIVGSLQGAATDFIKDGKADSDAQIKALRSVTDIFTGQLFSKGGPLASAFGGALVDSFWNHAASAAEAATRGDVDAVLGALSDLGDATGDALADAIDANFPTGSWDQTGINGPGILADYETAVDIARTNPD